MAYYAFLIPCIVIQSFKYNHFARESKSCQNSGNLKSKTHAVWIWFYPTNGYKVVVNGLRTVIRSPCAWKTLFIESITDTKVLLVKHSFVWPSKWALHSDPKTRLWWPKKEVPIGIEAVQKEEWKKTIRKESISRRNQREEENCRGGTILSNLQSSISNTEKSIYIRPMHIGSQNLNVLNMGSGRLWINRILTNSTS